MSNVKAWIIGCSAVAVLGGALALGVAVNEGRLPTGTSVNGVDVSGLNQTEALAKVKATIKVPQVSVKAPSNSAASSSAASQVSAPQSWTLSAEKLGYQVDANSSVAAAFSDAENRNLVQKVQDLAGQIAGQSSAQDYPLKISVDASVAKKTLAELTAPLNTAPKSGKIFFDKTRYAMTPDTPGQKMEVDTAATAFASDPSLRELTISTVPWISSDSSAKLQALVDKGNALLRPMTVQLGDSQHTGVLSALQVANLFWVRPSGLELDKAAMKQSLKTLSSYLDEPAQNARYANQGGKLVRVEEQAGFVTDQAAALAALSKAVLDPSVKTLSLPSKTQQPSITVAALPDPTKLTLITTGVSTYYHSSPERRTNVANAAAKIDGAVVEAGGVFSFLNTLGSISEGNGFVGGLIISGGRTVDGLGGGVCQVSTTTFRALYQAGMPIVERNQHSYRVGYYEPRVGFEAAVYDPGVDLKMKNDTGGLMLIRTVNNNALSRLEVQVWGVPQSRTVSVSGATILSSTPHPAPKYIVNSSLPRGASKQVDWAANGYNLYITRTIKDASGVRTDRMDTLYKPWQAVYEMGPS
ncbi:hypothetical protein EHF33_01490 [Deinococcus psychrotolerans]|uniref:YoaR-like putative peptidoglycan binding domain-containing protein n=1 Tax=Deinococcus psychrotolerans TaxID=2489213 RepID=A0A3G8Y893_9DEIO|nr:VanW family protein [Deinococcus psychrotolerans]AZI41592.1 hypothetical protein EHF33_01490 [Deinococcus psychrotolerans]